MHDTAVDYLLRCEYHHRPSSSSTRRDSHSSSNSSGSSNNNNYVSRNNSANGRGDDDGSAVRGALVLPIKRSLLNHSCRANTATVMAPVRVAVAGQQQQQQQQQQGEVADKGRVCYLRAIEDIKPGRWTRCVCVCACVLRACVCACACVYVCVWCVCCETVSNTTTRHPRPPTISPSLTHSLFPPPSRRFRPVFLSPTPTSVVELACVTAT